MYFDEFAPEFHNCFFYIVIINFLLPFLHAKFQFCMLIVLTCNAPIFSFDTLVLYKLLMYLQYSHYFNMCA